MSILVPADLGGEGGSIGDAVDICYALGRACASTAMIFAMHQIMVAILVRHGRDSAWHQGLLRRICAEQWLIASSTTDGTGGGDLRASTCAVTPAGARISLRKDATVMSYGAEADAILTTARRAPDAPAADQVLVALAHGDYRLERTLAWDALGMRGTCSAGFMLMAEGVVEALAGLITRHREPGTEVLRFPPIMNRREVERSGYLHSFPHLLGCVCGLHGEEIEIHAAVSRSNAGGDWADALKATDLALTPAACYPLYPLAASRGAVPASGLKFDVESYCFRREASFEVDRLQAFRMREYVCMGSPGEVVDFRARWLERAKDFAEGLGLPHRIAPASDPFFGRAARLIAASQVEQLLKFELLVPLRSQDQPTACMSFNYHRDHFAMAWDLRSAGEDVVHTACVAFGMDRLALALFAIHGVDILDWPRSVRATLEI